MIVIWLRIYSRHSTFCSWNFVAIGAVIYDCRNFVVTKRGQGDVSWTNAESGNWACVDVTGSFYELVLVFVLPKLNMLEMKFII